MIFGEQPISPKELVERLSCRASEIAEERDPQHSNTAWTYAIKHALAEMAKERGFKQLFSHSDGKLSEFMLDAVWFSDKSGNAAVLGVESEWGNPRVRDCQQRANCVAEDFEKLLQFKAPMKLMIFQADNVEMRKAIHKILLDYLQAFRQHVAGETYVFIEFSAGKCLSYTCEIQKDGQDTSLTLNPLNAESAEMLLT
jgi:hypothetical protein